MFKNIKVKNIILFITILFVFLTFEVIFLLLDWDFKNLTLSDTLIMTLSKYFFIILFMFIYYHKYLKDKWDDFRKHFKEYTKIAFKDWFAGFLIMYISNIIIMRLIGSVGQNEETVQGIISQTPVIAFFLTTIFAPFIEEMIFRKSLQDCFNNTVLFMFMSGFIFGLIHVIGGSQLEYLLIIPYGALGFMFAHTLNKTNNIYPTIMMHMFHNGVLTLLAILGNLL